MANLKDSDTWQQDLDAFLHPHDVVFSEAGIYQSILDEIRRDIEQKQFPFLLEILLYNGIGSFFFRYATILLLVILPAIYLHESSPFVRALLILLSAVICGPGIWMWWHTLIPRGKRINRMLMLLNRAEVKMAKKL